MVEKYTIYDLETLANCFTAYFKDWKTGKEKYFVCSPWQNDFMPLMKFLRKLTDHGYTLVGFNCNGFDAQILEYLIFNIKKLSKWTGEQIAKKCHEKAQWIINLPREERWMNLIPEWKFNIPHLDIFKQKHYDGKGKACSLKWLEFTMRFPNIKSMPIHHDTLLEEEDQVRQIIGYNGTDVRATYESFKLNKFETDLRLQLSEEYNLNLLNASEPRLARDIFGKFFTEALGVPYNKEFKDQRSYRGLIKVKELIFDYVVFKDPVLQGVKKFYEKLEFNPYKFEENNMGLKKVKKTFSIHNIKDADVGLGGIHACVDPGVYTSRPDWNIIDIDVESFYPNLGIKNELHPEHLDQGIFCSTYEGIFNKRKEIPKESQINLVYKIILNSTYGLSKEPNNYLHDPKYTFSITINGQLLLLMLAELLTVKVPAVIYQMNTDGITMGYHPDHEKIVRNCIKKWEDYTKLKLEDKFYDKLVIVDVNNYLAVDTKGKVKRKGLFAYSMNPADKEMEYHRNPSFLVIAKALEAYFVNNVPYRDYIKSNQDIYDFCGGVKVKRDFNMMEHWYDHEDNCIRKRVINERVVRYFVTTEFTSLKKTYNLEAKMAGKTVEIEKGWNTKLFNIYYKSNMEDYNINYDYYITKTREVVDLVSKHATNLKLF